MPLAAPLRRSKERSAVCPVDRRPAAAARGVLADPQRVALLVREHAQHVGQPGARGQDPRLRLRRARRRAVDRALRHAAEVHRAVPARRDILRPDPVSSIVTSVRPCARAIGASDANATKATSRGGRSAACVRMEVSLTDEAVPCVTRRLSAVADPEDPVARVVADQDRPSGSCSTSAGRPTPRPARPRRPATLNAHRA